MEVELFDLRKTRKLEEKRVRSRILDEYDGLIQALVKEIAVVKGRFHEYQVSNLNDIMNVMSEAQREQLGFMATNMNLPESMRDVATSILAHQEQIQELRQQNQEFKLTILKIRSLFMMKEQALKAHFDGKVRKLSEDKNDCEAKLWNSYRDAEGRERVLRKQLAKLQKSKATLEIQCDNLQRQLKDEVEF